MKNRVFAYVCTPHRTKEGFLAQGTKEYLRALYKQGYVPICPNIMFSQFLSDSIPDEKESRREMALALLRRCRVLVVCGEHITEEMTQEMLLAEKLGIVAVTFDGIGKIALYTKKGEEVR